ncbi:MAG: hypothetical protein ABIP06_10400, partial [Pyrinomonadaceae bacterium]
RACGGGRVSGAFPHRRPRESAAHADPNPADKRPLIAGRMNFEFIEDFNKKLKFHTTGVNRIFERVFQKNSVYFESEIPDTKLKTARNEMFPANPETEKIKKSNSNHKTFDNLPPNIISSLEKSDVEIDLTENIVSTLKKLAEVSPYFTEMLAANPTLIKDLSDFDKQFAPENYLEILLSKIERENDFPRRLAALRKIWARFLFEIITFDVFEKITPAETKRAQTRLAEASIETAIFITKSELENKFSIKLKHFQFAVLALGKLGGKGVDYGSDLDLVLVYDDEQNLPVENLTHAEFYARAVEIFVNSLSAMTRDGQLYRVDLRLRPDGKNGAPAIGKTAFLDYLKNRSAIWEWLAYVKIRGVAGDMGLADFVGQEARKIIHENAQIFHTADENFEQLKMETLRIRESLERQKSTSRKGREIDIKFGEGGMLDVYFAVRFLQLRDNLPDSGENRSTLFMLEKLFENGSISEEDFRNFSGGYKFLSDLDHILRLTVGRSTRLPLANRNSLETIVQRMKLGTIENLLETLTLHRLNLRASFENVLKI